MPRSDISNQGLDGCHNVEEKRAKREIANMNERRRMQNINSGFHSLRALLPQKHDGEKLSKAAILQHTSSYIYQLEQEITKLLNQNSELKRVVGGGADGAVANINTPDWIKRLGSQPPDCPSCKRRKYETNNKLDIDSSPLGADGSSTESSSEQEISAKQRTRMHNKSNDSSSIRNQLARLERQLEEERRARALLEEELNSQGKLSNLNGRQYQTAMDHIPDEVEIASESIEIEMHSCPASPPDVMTIAANDHLTGSGGAVYLTNQIVGNKMDHHNHNHHHLQQQQQQRVQKQNAIALPIDVPFVAPRDLSLDDNINCRTVKTTGTDGSNSLVVVVDSNGVVSLIDSSKIQNSTSNSMSNTNTITTTSNNYLNHSQILQLIPNGGGANAKQQQQQICSSNININNNHGVKHSTNNSGAMDSQKASLSSSPDSAKTSRQNLNTIVEAIRHLEGEHMFNHIFNDTTATTAAAAQDKVVESKESIQATIVMSGDNNNKLLLQQQQPNNHNNNNNTSDNNKSNQESTNSIVKLEQQQESNLKNGILETAVCLAPDNHHLQQQQQQILVATDLSKNSSSNNNNNDSQQRPQIIQIQQRPNVIVSNSGVE